VHFIAWRRRNSGPKSAKNQPLCPYFCSFYLPLSLSPPFQPPNNFSTTSSITGSYLNHKPATPMPETATVSSSFSLLQKSSSSPRGWLRPPLLAETPPEPPDKPLDHGRDSCFEWVAPPPTSIFCSHFGCMHYSHSANN